MTAIRNSRASALALASLVWLAGANAASAGPNAGGTLIAHANPSIVYCSDSMNYCGQSDLSACDQAITEVNGDATVLYYVLAAFPAAGSPRLMGTEFGIDYDPDRLKIQGYGGCGDFELHTSNWPEPVSGTAITWDTVQTQHLVEVYWFAAYNYASPAPTTFAITEHPTRGGGCCFADDHIPPILDNILGRGSLGFDEPGSLPCPDGGPPGACCTPDCECLWLPEIPCAAQGGNFQGVGVSCEPNPCCPWPSGACCFGCDCLWLAEYRCIDQGGVFQGDNASRVGSQAAEMDPQLAA
ncbi:MAG: hypothetical protein U0527_10615 [Candidatus Eisenbacteria bacterium]